MCRSRINYGRIIDPARSIGKLILARFKEDETKGFNEEQTMGKGTRLSTQPLVMMSNARAMALHVHVNSDAAFIARVHKIFTNFRYVAGNAVDFRSLGKDEISGRGYDAEKVVPAAEDFFNNGYFPPFLGEALEDIVTRWRRSNGKKIQGLCGGVLKKNSDTIANPSSEENHPATSNRVMPKICTHRERA